MLPFYHSYAKKKRENKKHMQPIIFYNREYNMILSSSQSPQFRLPRVSLRTSRVPAVWTNPVPHTVTNVIKYLARLRMSKVYYNPDSRQYTCNLNTYMQTDPVILWIQYSSVDYHQLPQSDNIVLVLQDLTNTLAQVMVSNMETHNKNKHLKTKSSQCQTMFSCI